MESQFDSLPGEVIERTLYYFNVSDRQKFRLISKFWNETITKLYGVTLRVHNINLDESLACKSSPVSGYFQSLTLPMPMNDTGTGTDFLSRLTSLTFTGVIVCYNIFPVFEQCQQIRKLEFIRCIVNQNTREYQVDLEDPSKLLPSLRALVIKLRYSPSNSSEINFFTRLFPFFTSESGKLGTIVLDCPCRLGGPVGTTFDKIFQKNSIRVNRGNLVSERSLDEAKIAHDFYNSLILKNIHSLRNLEMADGGCASTFKMKFCTEQEGEDFSNVQFSEFEHELYCFDLRQNFSSITKDYGMSLTNLLHPQIHLTKLSVTASRAVPMNQVYSIASKNAETLKNLMISYTDFDEGLIDAFSLNQLHVLQNFKYLYLLPTNYSTDDYSVMYNFNYLPSSLRTLSITGTICFENENDFNMAAFQRLQKLETLELLYMPFFFFGHFAEIQIHEMDPQRIRQLISWLPSLKKMVVRNIHTMGLIHDHLPPPVTDALPDRATDWINNEAGISFQKYPIVIESINPKRNSGLIAQPVSWESVYLPNDHPFEFPVHFDGIFLIQPEFRQNTPL